MSIEYKKSLTFHWYRARGFSWNYYPKLLGKWYIVIRGGFFGVNIYWKIMKKRQLERILDCPFCDGEPIVIEPTEGFFPDEMPHMTCADESCPFSDWIPIDDWQRRSF